MRIQTKRPVSPLTLVAAAASVFCAPLLLGNAGTPAFAQEAAQATRPVAQWTFDEGTGMTAADAVGGNGATLQGGAAWDAGLVGAHSLRLPGQAGSFVSIPKPVVDTSRSFTFTACVRLNRVSGYQTFVSIDGDRISGFFFQFRDDTEEFALTIPPRDGSGDGVAIASSQIAPEPNVWYHLAGVYDASAGTVSLYVNGVLQEKVPCKSAWRATGDTVIGRGKFGGNPVDFVQGNIDDVRLYDTALSADAVGAIARADLPADLIKSASQANPGPASLVIHGDQPGPRVSPMLYGLMTEEINYSYDGGLYGELIRNRQFRNDPKTPAHWTAVTDGGAAGTISLDTAQPLNEAQPISLKLDIQSASGVNARVGAANEGYWGIPVRPNTTYRASFYARAAAGFTGPLTVSLESAGGQQVFARAQSSSLTGDWKRYTVTLKTGGNITSSKENRFVVSAGRPGTVWLSLVSLFPPTYKGRADGNRIDLMEMMAAMKPAFLRMPGGNYLEGDTIETRFDWKKTIGPVENRPGHQGPWGYRSTDGMGLMEFLLWCDELKMEPLLAVYAGYSLQQQHVEPGEALKPYVQDALDEIEYLIGPTTSTWGAMRAKNGHPAPFALHYVEIGNEDWFDRSGSYDGRFAQFYDAIKAKYPQLQLIATAAVKSRKPDVVDEHYYKSPRAFERDAHRYDTYDRNGPKIFVGEWASQDGKPTPNLNSAIGDAAWMTGMERNSDIVVLEAYAPLFVNVNPGGSQWGTNLIGYDALNSFGSPSYYAQAMFATNHGDVVIPATITGRQLFTSVTRDTKSGMLYVKIVNAAGAAQDLSLQLDGFTGITDRGTTITLSGAKPTDTNTLASPKNIVPVTRSISGFGKTFHYNVPAYSVVILKFGAKPGTTRP